MDFIILVLCFIALLAVVYGFLHLIIFLTNSIHVVRRKFNSHCSKEAADTSISTNFVDEINTLFRKYGASFSYTMIKRLKKASASAKNDDEFLLSLISLVPDKHPTINGINTHSKYYANSILSRCKNNELRKHLNEQFSENISEIKDADLQNIYNAQKSMYPPEQETLYRFNYEHFAFVIIFTELNDISSFLFPQQEINEYKETLLQFGKENGYTLNTSTLINETIEHFKMFFKKYGFTPSPEEIADIMTKYAIAKSDGDSDLILFQFIPDEIPPPDKFFDEITYHTNSLLENLPASNIKKKIIDSFNNSRDEISDIELCELYEFQKSTFSEETLQYFRFNYELCAIVMIASFCDDLINNEEYDNEEALEEINELTQSVLNLAKNLGYTSPNQ